MVHNRDNQEVGVAHDTISPKNQPQFSQMMGQYCLDKTKPKTSFQINLKKLLRIFLKTSF